MKIAFTGAQSTGKTTLLNMLREKEQLKDYIFYDNITRSIQDEGYSINRNSCAATQYRIAKAHQDICNTENFIADRSMIDCYVYSLYLFNQGKLKEDEKLDLYLKMLDLVGKYDYIFYIRPEFEPVADGVRDVDREFVSDIAKLFEDVINDLIDKPLGSNIILITGTPEERIQQVMTEVTHC